MAIGSVLDAEPEGRMGYRQVDGSRRETRDPATYFRHGANAPDRETAEGLSVGSRLDCKHTRSRRFFAAGLHPAGPVRFLWRTRPKDSFRLPQSRLSHPKRRTRCRFRRGSSASSPRRFPCPRSRPFRNYQMRWVVRMSWVCPPLHTTSDPPLSMQNAIRPLQNAKGQQASPLAHYSTNDAARYPCPTKV